MFWFFLRAFDVVDEHAFLISTLIFVFVSHRIIFTEFKKSTNRNVCGVISAAWDMISSHVMHSTWWLSLTLHHFICVTWHDVLELRSFVPQKTQAETLFRFVDVSMLCHTWTCEERIRPSGCGIEEPSLRRTHQAIRLWHWRAVTRKWRSSFRLNCSVACHVRFSQSLLNLIFNRTNGKLKKKSLQ